MRSPYLIRASWLSPAGRRRTGPAVGARSDGDVGRLDALDAGAGHVGPRLGEGAPRVDASSGVLDHGRREPRLTRVERRPPHAEVRGEPDQVDVAETALAQVTAEAGRGLPIGLQEGRVGVDVLPVPLPDDQLGVGDAEAGREGGALGALDAVVRPEDLRAVRELDRLERLLAGM